jgi:hypothetical protein
LTVPFEIALLASTLARMRERSSHVPIGTKEMVFEVTYEPSHGGIICLIRPNGTDNLVATSNQVSQLGPGISARGVSVDK